MGEPSSLTSRTPLAHLVMPLTSSSDKPKSLRLVSGSLSDGISSDSLTVAGIEAGFNSDGLKVRPMVGINCCLDRISSNSTTVVGLEFGTSSDDGISSDNLTVAGIEAGFTSDGLKVRPKVGINCCLDRISSDSTAVDGLEFGTNSDSLEVVLLEINSYFSAGFNSTGHEVAQMDLYGTSPGGFNSDDFRFWARPIR
ncbi:hypothetical protein SO802_005770 [Lithocarpus litseifolius]|uniref:Uncharacterized protein n=1 Tax=Lithocarpus litseifolius TaxID=425828 RepID=A0AAW2DJF8_9ROSI